ncbi:hypothetical protein [Actinoplanes sp. CA-252034]|uniref:hypothetical protein n=1 Tax=Actinoplanes sp. CA-252034 TaxID=3239906 RepID=UPI003D950FE3
MWSKKWWLVAAGVTVLLVVAGFVWWRWDGTRQPRVEDVVAGMNTAVADAVTAAGQDVAVTVSPVVAAAECPLGLLRTGRVFTGKADLYTDPGGEETLIDTIEQRLAGRYAVRRGTAVAGVRTLEADVGTIRLSARRLSPGWLAVTARSGCSLGTAGSGAPGSAAPGSSAPGSAAPGSGSPASGVDAVNGLLTVVGARAAAVTEQHLRCPSGDMVTVSAVSEPVEAGRLAERFLGTIPAGARTFSAAGANRVAYRDGAVSVVIAASDDGAAVTAQHTVSCPG